MRIENGDIDNKIYSLIAKVEKIPVNIKTDAGSQESQLKGEIIFHLRKTGEAVELQLRRLNLLGSPVKCKDGSSGLLSLKLHRGSVKIRYSREGKVHIEFETKLHYPLIAKNTVYLQPEAKDPDYFNPHVDTAKGVLDGEFGLPLDTMVDAIIQQKTLAKITDLKFTARILATEYLWVLEIELPPYNVELIPLIGQNWINIQPVFIRDNASDQSPTGWAFDDMMQSAQRIWKKCRVHFNVLDPIYLDNTSYKVLSSRTEVINLKDEVNTDDAIEIFVVTRFDPIRWGGGATFDSGTANAKIVTCDEQLSVTDPTGQYLGAVNINHLAHELGHVLGLSHPGSGNPRSLIAGTPNTVMNVSGFYADNPSQQSQDNCDNADNPLFYSRITELSRRWMRKPKL